MLRNQRRRQTIKKDAVTENLKESMISDSGKML